jgi:hypothetical protein
VFAGGAKKYLGVEKDPMLALASKRRISVATWNIAAINNNVSLKFCKDTSSYIRSLFN